MNAPRETGALADSFSATVEYRNGTTYVLYTSSKVYARYQEAGTGIYGPMKRYITPKRAKVLSWMANDGQRVFAKRVKGSPPQLYMYRSLVDVFGVANAESFAATHGKAA